ncbi:MAG TPA: hypothetical protein VNE62_11060, partial [Actinomycetota bacterium]|nr:hypothetical protein [Actinomycetota bacterium]
LSPLTEAGEVRTTVAKALSVPLDQSAALAEYIGRGRLLLILDNCEHVVDEVAQLVEHLVRSCPAITIFATSRELLGVDGEMAWRVPSLSLPEGDLSDVERYESVRLFCDRAIRARSGFRLDPDTAPAVASICKRVDGIPLAIELAAARTKVLTPKQISDGLTDCFRLLAGGSRTLMPRQQTLRASVDWSYRLLDPAEQTLLRRMSVFVGGCTLEAAEAVRAQDDVEAFDVLDLLTRLVDKSLVAVEHKAGKARYRLLETIRRFAAEKLADSGEAEQVLAKSRDYWRRFVDRPMEDWYAASGFDLLIEVDAEWQNISAAVEDLQSLGKAREASQIAVRLSSHAPLRGRMKQVAEWLQACADQLEVTEPVVAVRCLAARLYLLAMSSVTGLEDDLVAAKSAAQEQEPEDARDLQLLMAEALVTRFTETQRSLDVFEQVLGMLPEDSVMRGMIPGLRSFAELALGRTEDAKRSALEAVAHHRQHGRSVAEAIAIFHAGMVHSGTRDLSESRKYYEQVIPLLDRLEYKVFEQWAIDHVTGVCIKLDDTDAALVWAERGINLSRSTGITGGSNFPFLLMKVAALSERSGHYERGLAAALEAVEVTDHPYHAQALTWAGLLAQRAGDPRASGFFIGALLAGRGLEVTTDLRSGTKRVPTLAEALGGLAREAVAGGRLARCARLWGAAEARREFEEQASGAATGNFSRESRREWVESCLRPAREALGPRWEVEFQRGRELAKDDAIAYALEEESTEVARALIKGDRDGR